VPCWVWVGGIGGYFLKVFTTYLLGMSQANCFKTHNKPTTYPPGKLPFAPSEGDEYQRYIKTYHRQEKIGRKSVASEGEPITNSDMYTYVANLAMIAPDEGGDDSEPDINDQGIPDEKVYCEPNYSDDDFYQTDDEEFGEPYEPDDSDESDNKGSDPPPNEHMAHATNEWVASGETILKTESPDQMNVDDESERRELEAEANRGPRSEEKELSKDRPREDFLYQRSQTYGTDEGQREPRMDEQSGSLLTKETVTHLDEERVPELGKTKDNSPISEISDEAMRLLSSPDIPEGMFASDLDLPDDHASLPLDQSGEDKGRSKTSDGSNDKDKKKPAKTKTCYRAGIFGPFLNDFHFCYLCIQLHFTFVSHFKEREPFVSFDD